MRPPIDEHLLSLCVKMYLCTNFCTAVVYGPCEDGCDFPSGSRWFLQELALAYLFCYHLLILESLQESSFYTYVSSVISRVAPMVPTGEFPSTHLLLRQSVCSSNQKASFGCFHPSGATGTTRSFTFGLSGSTPCTSS